jgi:hypothetical protein
VSLLSVTVGGSNGVWVNSSPGVGQESPPTHLHFISIVVFIRGLARRAAVALVSAFPVHAFAVGSLARKGFLSSIRSPAFLASARGARISKHETTVLSSMPPKRRSSSKSLPADPEPQGRGVKSRKQV